jgi:pantothenate kinase-related protein Tda10
MPQAVALDVSARTQATLATEISDRLSQELVIALVGPVGSGVSTSAKYLSEILSQQFQYEVAPIIKLSDFIRVEAHRIGIAEIPRDPISYLHQ